MLTYANLKAIRELNDKELCRALLEDTMPEEQYVVMKQEWMDRVRAHTKAHLEETHGKGKEVTRWQRLRRKLRHSRQRS